MDDNGFYTGIFHILFAVLYYIFLAVRQDVNNLESSVVEHKQEMKVNHKDFYNNRYTIESNIYMYM